MQTTELADRLCRRLDVSNLGNAPADVHRDILDAINAALQEFYRKAPEHMRRIQISRTLRAEVSQNATVQTGSNAITGGFSDDDAGRTILIGDDDAYNILTTGTTLLDAYRGTLQGSVQCRIYGDAIAFPGFEIERIADTLVLDNGQSMTREREARFSGKGETFRRTTGQPTRYLVDLIGTTAPFPVVRVDPLPDRDYSVRFRAIFATARIGQRAILTPQALPVPAQFGETILLPLAHEYLVASPYWNGNPELATRTVDAAARARQALQMIPSTVDQGRNRIGTPAFF